MEIITSRHNPTIKQVRKLAQGRKPGSSEPAYVEGILPLLRALENQVPVELIIYAPDLLRSTVAQQAVADAAERRVVCMAVSADVFASVSARDNPVGLAGLVRPPARTLADLLVDDAATFTVLNDVKNPGNLGAIIRTVDATAGQGVVLLGQTADPLHPASIRASVGTVFGVPTVRIASPQELLAWCVGKNIAVMATSARAPLSLHAAQLKHPLAVMLGSEAQGLPAELLGGADLAVSLPMYGQASSLNLAVAAGIILYDVKRRAGDASAR